MARIRSIHPDALKSEKLAASSAEAERCYWRLQPHCDDDGRAEDDPRNLRSMLFPVAEPPLPAVLVDGWLAELARIGLIVRYEVAGRRYLQVVRFADYQKPNHPTPSKLPPIPDDYGSPLESSGGCNPGEGEGGGVGEGVKPHVELTLVSAAPRDRVREVFDAWCYATGHPGASLDRKRRGHIERALASHPVEDVIDAVRGIAKSSFHQGANDRGRRYDDISVALRDAAHIEEFRDLERGQRQASALAPPLLGALARLPDG